MTQTTYIVRQKVPIVCCPKSLAKEVAKMTEEDNEDITEISRQQDVVRRVSLWDTLHGMLGIVLRGVAVGIVGAVTELGVDGGEHLLRGWWILGVCEPVFVFVCKFVKDRVFG